MNELMILNEDNREEKNYAIYYTINDRFYIIYTNKEKDENNYVILHIAKVLKEVNNTPEGIVPTGKYIGLEISDQSEWDNAKTNIGEIVSNKQNNTETSVTYLPVSEINGISIKSSKTFKLREDIVNSIIVESSDNENGSSYEMPVTAVPTTEEVVPTSLNDFDSVSIPTVSDNMDNNDQVVADIPVALDEAPVVTDMPTSTETSSVDDIETPTVSSNEEFSLPTIAPNPFEMQPEIDIPQTETVEEEKTINPYEVMQQQRAEEMINALANDNMQDIVANPVISVSELENNSQETPVVESTSISEEVPVVSESIVSTEDESAATNIAEPTTAPIETPTPEVQVKTTPEVVSSESFVDSIVADVSDILDKKEEPTVEEKEDYERLYNDALEKTVELEKELAELHNKLNNIKNIVE